MTDKELKHLIESNAKTVQAMLDEIAEARQEHQELREGMLQIQNAMAQLTNIQDRITNLLISVDGDRPTILKKLSALETKLDRLLQQNPTDELG
jgi:two-component sensor histidine kinase